MCLTEFTVSISVSTSRWMGSPSGVVAALSYDTAGLDSALSIDRWKNWLVHRNILQTTTCECILWSSEIATPINFIPSPSQRKSMEKQRCNLQENIAGLSKEYSVGGRPGRLLLLKAHSSPVHEQEEEGIRKEAPSRSRSRSAMASLCKH